MAFPVDAARTATNASTASNPVVVTLPAYAAGDLCILFFRNNNGIITTPTGWTPVHGPSQVSTTDDSTIVAWRKMDGTEGSTVSVTLNGSQKASAVVWTVTGAADPTVSPPLISSAATGTSTTPDPPSFSPAGGAKEWLWFWLASYEGEQTSPPASNPTNYSNPTGANSGTGGAVATNCRVAGATRQNNTATEDPPTWTISVSALWQAFTLAVPPATNVPRNPGIDSGFGVLCKAWQATRKWKYGRSGIVVPDGIAFQSS